MTGPRIGSLFSGYSGLDLAVKAVFPGGNVMTTLCARGTPVPTEAAAHRHAAVCDQQGTPGCRVTVYTTHPYTVTGRDTDHTTERAAARRCGAPCVDSGLCAHHAAERDRVIAADQARACPTCGATRATADTGPGWVMWECPCCGIAREETGA